MERKQFLRYMGAALGWVAIAPLLTACDGGGDSTTTTDTTLPPAADTTPPPATTPPPTTTSANHDSARHDLVGRGNRRPQVHARRRKAGA